ncbi:MAG: hypothetical protein M9946_05645, partial [Nocardioidaceae bacterium]|nr:hypothetical protein [Nocardioidaceae bacterium]
TSVKVTGRLGFGAGLIDRTLLSPSRAVEGPSYERGSGSVLTLAKSGAAVALDDVAWVACPQADSAASSITPASSITADRWHLDV